MSSCRVLQEMLPRVGAKVSWTTTRLVAEALDHGFHVVKDPPMIKPLGRTKFVELVVLALLVGRKG